MFPVFDKDAAASTNNWRLFRSGMVLELGRTLGRIPISRSGFIAWLIKLRKQVLSERCELFLTPTPGGN
jgi:hypothetical protein